MNQRTLLCINNIGKEEDLTKGKEYLVKFNGEEIVTVVCNDGTLCEFSRERFEYK